MQLMFNKGSGEILDASNLGAWQVPEFATTIEIPGNTDTFPWPHPQGPSSCIWDGNSVVANPAALPKMKQIKGAEFIAEGVTRIAAQVPDWDSLETIKTVAGLWASHLATNATASQLKAKDIYLYVRDTVPPKLAAVATQAELDAIDPTAADPFGDGTAWPS